MLNIMERGETATSLVSISNDILECSVCLDRLDTSSKVLPCQHTFCRKCLEDIVASKEELRCPECRTLVKMKVDDLPPNVLLMRILGGLKTSTPDAKLNCLPAVAPPIIHNHRKSEGGTAAPQPPAQQIQNLARPVLGGAPMKQLPQNVCHAKALFDFQSDITGDLAFKKGDVIVLRRRIDQNWFYGHLNGREGAFPVNHVQIIVPLPVPQCRAVFDFRMGPNEEEGCLTFAKGQIINVIRRIDPNWAEGRIGECIGIFPINFVEMNSLAKQLIGGGDKESRRTSLGEAMTTAAWPITGSNESPTSPTTGTTVQRVALPPMPAKLEQSNATTTTTATNYAAAAVVRRAAHASPMPPNGTNTNRPHSAEILNPIIGESIASNVSHNRHKFAGDLPRLQPHVAVFAYKPQKPDELELIKGAHYFVSERCQDGWLRGMNSARLAGVFPGNHVIPLKELPLAPLTPTTPDNKSNTPRINSCPTSPGVLSPTSPPVLPPRNQASTTNDSTPPEGEKKDSINLIKRITNNLKRSKSPPTNNDDNCSSLAGVVTTPNTSHSHVAQPRLLPSSAHGRSGSCPSQLLDLSGFKISPVGAVVNLQGQSRSGQAQPMDHALSFGSQRVRGQKERPTLHSLHRQLGERKGDLTTLSATTSSHKKANSLDAGRLISPVEASGGGGMKAGSSGGRGVHHQIKEKFRCIVSYPPNSEYELGLNVGDIVLVTKKPENGNYRGWYRGVHQRSGKSGLFPASFVEPVNAN